MDYIYERIKSDKDCQDYIKKYNKIVEHCHKKKIRIDTTEPNSEQKKVQDQLSELNYWLSEWAREKTIRKNVLPFDLAKKMWKLDIGNEEERIQPTFSYYHEDGGLSFPATYWSTGMFQAPLFQQVFNWFENKGYRNYVASNQFNGKVNYFFAITAPGQLTYTDIKGRDKKSIAEIACVEKLIELYTKDIKTNKRKTKQTKK